MMGIQDISAVMEFLRCSLDPSDWDTESGEEMEEEGQSGGPNLGVLVWWGS